MTAQEDLLRQAEEYLRKGEDAGLNYPTQQERQAAKMQLFEQFTREAKGEQIGEAASASEGGTVVGATPGGRDHSQIAAELEAERKKPNSAESFARRKKLRAELDNAIGDVQVTFTR